MTKSALEDLLMIHIQAEQLPMPEREYKFHPQRRFRWDMAWVDRKIACEVQGGIWIKGGHSTGAGISRDCEKLDEGVKLGWKVFHFTKEQIWSGYAIETLKEALCSSK